MFTYPENHKLDQEINNICQNEQNPIFGTATGSTMTVTQLNVSTIAVTGQIDMRSKKIINLANGTASTDAAAFGQLPTLNQPVAYTPAITGEGTISGGNFFWFKVGKMVHITGEFKSGTPSATTLAIPMPAGQSIDVTLAINGQPLGWFQNGIAAPLGGGGNVGFIFCDGSDTANLYVDPDAAAVGGWPTKANGNHASNGTTYQAFDCWVPVTS